MKQEFLEVLLYLFEQVFTEPVYPLPDPKAVASTLKAGGFESDEIDRAVTWVRVLMDSDICLMEKQNNTVLPSVRIYHEAERAKLGGTGLCFLQALEQGGLLDVASREAIISMAMAIEDTERLTLDQLKCIAVPILFNHNTNKQSLLMWIDGLDRKVQANLH